MDQQEIMTLEQLRQEVARLSTTLAQTVTHTTSVGASVTYNAELLNAPIGRVNVAEAAMTVVIPELARMQSELSRFLGFGTRVEDLLKHT